LDGIRKFDQHAIGQGLERAPLGEFGPIRSCQTLFELRTIFEIGGNDRWSLLETVLAPKSFPRCARLDRTATRPIKSGIVSRPKPLNIKAEENIRPVMGHSAIDS
jgi:hypothetical protein